MTGMPPQDRVLPAWMRPFQPFQPFPEPPQYPGVRTTREWEQDLIEHQEAERQYRARAPQFRAQAPQAQPAAPQDQDAGAQDQAAGEQVVPGEDDFVVPPAQFSPSLMAGVPTDPLLREKWFEQAAAELNAYFLEAEARYLEHMAQRGLMAEYLTERAQQDEDFQREQQIAAMAESIPWTNTRDPGALAKWQQTARQLGAAPGFEEMGLRLQADMSDYARFVQTLDEDRAAMTELAKAAVKGEAERWAAFTPLRAAVHGLNPLNIATSFGDPESRILADVYDETNRRVAAFERQYRNTTSKHIPDPERYRRMISAAGVAGALEEMQRSKVDEGGLERFGRRAGELLGFLGGGGVLKLGSSGLTKAAAKAAGGLARAERLETAAAALSKAAGWVSRHPRLVEAGAILAAGYAGGLSPEQKAALLHEDMSEEDRKRAEEAGAAANALMGYLAFPVMHFAQAAGRNLTMGVLSKHKATRFLEPALALPALGEAQTWGFAKAREFLSATLDQDADLQKDLDLLLLTHPKMQGPIERLWNAKTNEEARAAALAYGEEVLPAAAGLGAFAALMAAAPAAINRPFKAMADRDIDRMLKGEPLQQQAVRQMVQDAPVEKPTAEQRLVERVGPERAQQAIRIEEQAERRRAFEAELAEPRARGEEVEAERREIQETEASEAERARLAEAEMDDGFAYSELAERAKTPQDAQVLLDLAEQKFDRARALREGKELPAMSRLDADASRLVRSMLEGVPQREQIAERLLKGGLEEQAERLRVEAFEREGADLLAGAKRPAPEPRPGDELRTAAGLEARVEHVEQGVAELRDAAGMPIRRTTEELVREGAEIRSTATTRSARRQRQLEREAREGSGIAVILLEGGLHPDFARQVGAGDIRRPGFTNRKGIRSIDELAARLEAWGLGKDQVEAWLADAIAGKRRPLDVDRAVERAYADLEARAREQQEFEAEAAGKKAETFAARVERETARKVRPRSRKERIEAEQRQAEVLGEQNAKDARQDLVRRMEAHESDPAGAPPPGESVVPRRARAALDLAAEVAKSGVLGRIAEAKDRATVEAPAGVAGEFAAFAKAAPKSVKVEQLLYEWLHEKLGLPRPAETIASVTKRLRAELDDIANLRPHRRPEAVKLFLERHVELLQGPALPAMRLTRQGLMVANKIEALLALDAAEFGSIEVPTAREAVAASFRAMRALFPWSTPEGLPTFSFSPGALAQLTRAMTELIAKDPDTDVLTLKQAVFRRLGIEHPETWGGRVAHDMALASNAVITEARNLLRGLIGKQHGMLREIVGDGPGRAEARERLFHALNEGPKYDRETGELLDGAWKKLSDKERAWAEHLRGLMRDFRRKLLENSPYMAHLRRELELAGLQETAHKHAAEQAKNKGLRMFHVKRAAAYRKRAEAIQEEMQRKVDFWGIAEFVHHVRAEEQTTLEHYQRRDWLAGEKLHSAPGGVSVGAMQRRTGKLEASGELLPDIVASLVDYIPQAVSYVHRNAFFQRYHEFFYGREMPATWADVTRPDRDAVFHFRGRDYQVFGEVWVDKNGGVREPVPGEQPPKGSVRRILLMDWKDRGATFIRSTITPSLRQVERGVRSDVKGLAAVAARLVERHAKRGERGFNRGVQTLLRNTIPVDGNFRLVAPRELLDITVRKGGWFGRASRARAADMTELLDRFAGGMRNLQLSPFPLGNFFAKAGRLASYMKLAFNVPAAVNVWFSAMIQNSTTQPPKQLAESTLAAIEFYGRLFAARNAPIDLAELQKESGFTFGRSKMGSTAEQLKGLTGEALEKRLLYDEAFQELYRHPLFEAKFSDLARRMFVPATKEARGQAAEQLRAMFGKAKSKGAEFWKAATKFTGMEPIAAADHFARTVDFLGSYFSLRRAGESRAEASRRATMNVVRNHGIFNQVTRSRLIGSNFGQFAFGLQTYIMRQFDIWTRMPAEYKLRYASIALGSNYLWRALGIGDLTNQLGFSAYEIPLVGDAMEVLGLGDDDPGLEDELQHSGFVPVPLSVQGGPGMQAIGAAIRTLQGLAEGRPVGRDVMRGVASLFEPAVLAQWQRAFGTQRSDAGFEYTPFFQEFAGSERTSYTLEQRGLAQYLRDLLPGTQPEVHRETEAGAIMRATDKRVAGRRRAVSEEARGVLRRFDEAKAAGALTPTLIEESGKQWRELVQRGKSLGLDLQSRVDEFRQMNRTDRLPPSMRAVLRAGSKESQVRGLTRLIERGISKDQLAMLAAELRGERSLMEWALDGQTVSYETRKAFHAAVSRWRQQQQQGAAR